MIIIIGLILFFVCFVIFSRKFYSKNEKLFEIVSSIIFLFILVIGTYPILGYETPILQNEVEIVPLNEEHEKIDNNDYYLLQNYNSYMYKHVVNENQNEVEVILSDNVKIVESNKNIKPCIKVYKQKAKDNIWTFTGNQGIYSYYIEIPIDGIKNIELENKKV